MSVETFESKDPSADPTLPDDMDRWFEVYDADAEKAWVASDTTMEARR